MPQVDLSSVCVGVSHDRKVVCETLTGDVVEEIPPLPENLSEVPAADYAPESFWLSKDAVLDWLDNNAFIERKDSGKGSVSNPNPIQNPNQVSVSQRHHVVGLKSMSMIGLPKPQKPNYVEAKHRRNCRPSNIRLFPKRSVPAGGKPAVAVYEPSSPKVSCMGRVRSRKDRSRRGKNRKMKAELEKSKSIKEGKTGFWVNFRSIFRSRGNKLDGKMGKDKEPVARQKSTKKKRGFDFNSTNTIASSSVEETSVEPPGLGAVKRFASGRRSDAWAGDIEVKGAISEPLNQQRGPIWRRRESGPPSDVEVDRDWQTVGPASV